MINIEEYLEEKRNSVNIALINQLPKKAPSSIIEAMRYCLEAGGKRLRPILTLAASETIKAVDDNLVNLACALEYIHTYSLIHDDLPAMDDSNLRRGKPTCHCVYGDALAILAGDALLTLAFETIARYGQLEGNAEKAVKITTLLSKSAGMGGMIGGQVLDLEAEGKELSIREIENISELKTGALLKASVVCGAIAADASEIELKKFATYAENIGTAFQITDDLLDYEGTAEELGKPTGADREKAKATYPALLGPLKAREKAHELYDISLTAIKDLDHNTEILEALAKKIINRKN
ncbi:MAG: polyprenyl synthetase family protein [Bacillota bacterium]